MQNSVDLFIAARLLRRVTDAGLLVDVRIEREGGLDCLRLWTRLSEGDVQAVRVDGADDQAFHAAARQLARQCGVEFNPERDASVPL